MNYHTLRRELEKLGYPHVCAQCSNILSKQELMFNTCTRCEAFLANGNDSIRVVMYRGVAIALFTPQVPWSATTRKSWVDLEFGVLVRNNGVFTGAGSKKEAWK